MRIIEWVGQAAALVVVTFLAYVLFIIMPISFYADLKCKERGYPKSDVTINMQMYCMNLNGSTTVSVDKLQ